MRNEIEAMITDITATTAEAEVRCGAAEKPAQTRTQKISAQKERGKGALI